MLHVVGLLKEVLQTLQQLWEVGRLLISCSDLFLLSLLTHLGMHLMHSCGLQPHLQPRGNLPLCCAHWLCWNTWRRRNLLLGVDYLSVLKCTVVCILGVVESLLSKAFQRP